MDGLSKTYVNKKNSKEALRNVSFLLKPGKIFGVIGPNGAGKSTLFNILSMIIPRTEGSVMLLNQDITTFDSTKYGSNFGIVS